MLAREVGRAARLHVVQQIERVAAESTPEDTLRRVDALERTRNLLEANVQPLLAFESLTVALKDPSLA